MFFISVEPQSRLLLESYNNSLISQFTTHLEIITDRYLAFFNERRSIEANYIKDLRRLHRKAKTIDASYNPRAEPTTTRAAWDTVRDNLEREANTQQGFVDILDKDIIGPLTKLKETNVEIKKQIEIDLMESAANYADFAEDRISKLQHAYLKKYRGRWEDLREPEPAKCDSDKASDDDHRWAVTFLNDYRSTRVENLGGGYDCLQELVFTSTVRDILVRYVDGMSTTCSKYDNLATNTRAEVVKALAGTDAPDLRASFRCALSNSIPPLTFYRNDRPGAYSDLIFGVPMVYLKTNQDNVPKVMRMCIEEVEKRGLNTKKIYMVFSCGAEMLQLRRKFETELSFSFSPTDNIHSVAMLLRRYLSELPEPLFMLSLRDYRKYRQNRASYTENGFPLLRSKIRELHPVHRASLEVLLRHLLRVASHSDNNEMTVKALATQFYFLVLRGGGVLKDGVEVKILVMEDLIQNAHILFDERPSPSPPVPSPHVTDTMSMFTYGSSLSHELPQPAEVKAMGSGARAPFRRGPVGGIPTSTQHTFSSLSLDAFMESRLTPSPTALQPLLSPLPEFPSSHWQTLAEGVGTTSRTSGWVTRKARGTMGVGTTSRASGWVTRKARGTMGVETSANNTLAEIVSAPPPSSATVGWLSHQSRLSLHPEAVTIPQSPPGSVLSWSTSDFSLSEATSLQTGMGRFSP